MIYIFTSKKIKKESVKLRHFFFLSLLLGTISVLSACATYQAGANAWLNDIKSGDTNNALLKIKKDSKSQNKVLDLMNTGMIYRFRGEFQKSNQALQEAFNLSEELRAISIKEQAASVVLSDELKSYEGAFFETISIPIFTSLNYLNLGQCAEARIEVRKIAELVKQYPNEKKSAAWAVFYSGMVYEFLGEYNDARSAYRQAKNMYILETATKDIRQVVENHLQAIQGYSDNIGACTDLKTDDKNKSNLYQAEGNGDVIIIYQKGFISVPFQNKLVMNTNLGLIALAVPQYTPLPSFSSPTVGLRVRSNDEKEIPLAWYLTAPYELWARLDLQARIPAITARLLARATAKKAVVHSVTHNKDDGMKLLGMLLDIAQASTEVADTRAWPLLSSQVYVARINLPQGQYDFIFSNNEKTKKITRKIIKEQTQLIEIRLF